MIIILIIVFIIMILKVEYVPTEAFHEDEVMALSGAGKGVIVAGIILVQPFILAFFWTASFQLRNSISLWEAHLK